MPRPGNQEGDRNVAHDARNENQAPPPAAPPGNGKEEEAIGQVPLYRKKRVLIPFFILIVALAFGAWYWYKNLRNFVSTDDAYLDANRVSISPKVLGRIVVLTVDEGDHVKQGGLLVRLDETDLQAQVEQAKASLAFAQDSLPLAKVNVDRASDDFARADLQFKGAVITREQHAHAQQALEAAKAEYAIAVSKIAVAKAQLGVVETQLENMTLVAPFDGIVAKRWLLPGDVVQPGQPILTIYDTRLIWVTANLEETKLGRVKLKDRVEINIDTYPGRPFWGSVGLIGDYTAAQFSLIPPNNASGNFTKVTQRVPMKIYLDEQALKTRAADPLRPGMSVEIKIRVR
jgi:membrane fusion protein (multidrug efflux system)